MNEIITYYFIRNGKVSSDTSVPVGNVYMIGTDKAPLEESDKIKFSTYFSNRVR